MANTKGRNLSTTVLTLRFGGYALCIGLGIASLSGCGFGLFSALPAESGRRFGDQPLVNSSYKVLYRFKGDATDGNDPSGALTDVNGMFYGTTVAGTVWGGTVFQISKSGNERMLYGFQGGADGEIPTSGVTNVDATLYGTTEAGGAGSCVGSRFSGCGTVFKISTSGKESVIYTFKGGTDGWYPSSRLTNVGGTLYGTTQLGGAPCTGSSGFSCGTVFGVTTSGEERVIHRFKGGSDGGNPYGGVTAVNGMLYGTTYFDGRRSCNGGLGCGTIFELTKSGRERVLYSFKGGRDGAHPQSTLLALGRTLYGTTAEGGAGSCTSVGQRVGCGTIFSVSTSGKEHVLYRFNGPPDGQFPQELTSVNGALFGTAYRGGSRKCASGCGIIFKLDMSGHETVLYSFTPPPDGNGPHGGLLFANGKLYGTTESGGSHCAYLLPPGCGTVFRLSP